MIQFCKSFLRDNSEKKCESFDERAQLSNMFFEKLYRKRLEHNGFHVIELGPYVKTLEKRIKNK